MSKLAEKTSSAIVAVNDLERARGFYGGKLGLQEESGASEGSVIVYRTGDTHLTVYRSPDMLPGSGNAVAWAAGGDVEAIAQSLRAKAVTLEEYPEMGLEIVDGVHRAGGFRGIWFKDPDGNILHVNSM